ncbi:MAG TPA: ASKHA domain-containing protein [Symbiobacteriaceae bacterium]|nr:ASKHA domain-containing protein [Symbiobacteriaceae bacterium]
MTFTVRAAGRTLAVGSGARLSQVLGAGDVGVETPCGGRGYCRKCMVKVVAGAAPITAADREQLGAGELEAGFRLACQLVVASDLEVAVMPAAVADTKKAAMGRLSGPVEIDPWAPLLPAGRSVGFALDVGTTSLAGALLDLRTGEELAAGVLSNPQALHGADLMSRLSYACRGPGEARELQTMVTGAARQMLERLRSKAGVAPHEVVAATLVGNTAMHHLFLGLDVAGLAAAPYTPAVTDGQMARLPGLPPLYALPSIAGFVGADAVAAGLAAGLDQGDATVLLVDIGTNGEMLLRHKGTIYACSAPAGPAFEGGEISQGMRAGPGAVEAVTFADGRLHATVIPGAPPRGICGSGLLDATAALLAAGALDPTGRLMTTVALAPGVGLTQKDIRALQLAKGAIRSGIDLLLRVAEVEAGELDEILLAGAFGNYLRRESAIAIGLLPPVAPGKVRPIGNAAAAGAKLALLSRGARERAGALARGAGHVDLATHPDFEEIFIGALEFR